MPRPILRTALYCALLVLPLAALPGRSGAAPPAPFFPNVTGFWSGEYSSVTGLSGPASLDVTDQDRRRFQGTFTLYPSQPIFPPQPIRVVGTVSRSGEIHIVGRNGAVFLRARGSLFRGEMQLDYEVNFGNGTYDAGTTSMSIETGTGT